MRLNIYKSILGFVCWALAINCFAQIGIINTVVGNHAGGFSGDGGQATNAEINLPYGVTVDQFGNVYVADWENALVRKVDTLGVITTFAGNMAYWQGYSGDGGPATNAELYNPGSIAVDKSGNVFISDGANNVIREVNTAGIINTVIGNHVQGYSGDGGPASAAELYSPWGIAMDTANNLYIADVTNNVIRKVTHSTGIITTIAGGGSSSLDGVPATDAILLGPTGVTIDNSGRIYIAETQREVIRMVDTSGVIHTVAGNGYSHIYYYGIFGGYAGDGGPATNAELSNPGDVKIDSYGDIYISDNQNQVIRKVDTSRIISTVAGNGYISFFYLSYFGGYSGDGGPAIDAELNRPAGISIDKYNNLYFADINNNAIREVAGTISTGTTKLNLENRLMIVYPNPSNGIFTISMKNEKLKMKNIEVFNVLGEQVYSNNYQLLANSHQPITIDLSGHPNGIYFLKAVTEDGETLTQKVSVIR